VLKTRSGRINHHNGAVTPTGRAFDKLAERIEYSRHRMAARHHFEEQLLASRQVLLALVIFDVGRRPVPSHRFSAFVAERLDGAQERTKGTVEAP
jgi:hypothetical protein